MVGERLLAILEYVVPNPLWQRFKYRSFIREGVFIDPHVDIQGSRLGKNVGLVSHAQVINSVVGEYSSIGRNSKIVEAELGRYCSISWNVTVGATNHPYRSVTTHSFPYFPREGFVAERGLAPERVIIGHDVWVGCNSVIMPGVRVGHGAVIGAGAIVTADVPAYAVALGVPAAVKKFRFEREIMEQLLEIEWWEMAPELIREHVHLFQGEVDQDILVQLRELRGLKR